MRTSAVAGIVYANNNDQLLKKLTTNLSMASVPFGSRYRLIDFSLSNLVNAGIKTVGIITKENYRSLMDHVGSGVHWDLDRKNGGITMITPYSSSEIGVYKYRIDSLGGALDYLVHAKEDYVVISDSNVVTSFWIEDLVEEHINSGAQITVAYKKDIESNSYISINDGKASAFNYEAVSGEKNGYLETFVISS